MADNGFSVVEFEAGGRTYKIRVDGIGGRVTFNPHYFVNQMRDSVGQYTDLITGGQITVNWQQIGVIRVLETG